MGDIKVISLGGNFVASNSAQIVLALPAPAERQAYRLLSANYTAMDSQSNNDRCMMALHLGGFADGQTIQTGGHIVILGADPLQGSVFMRSFAHGAFGGAPVDGTAGGSHQVNLHGMVVCELVNLLVFLPDNTADLAWNADLFYESIRVSESEWTRSRHRPPVDNRLLGTVTV